LVKRAGDYTEMEIKNYALKILKSNKQNLFKIDLFLFRIQILKKGTGLGIFLRKEFIEK